ISLHALLRQSIAVLKEVWKNDDFRTTTSWIVSKREILLANTVDILRMREKSPRSRTLPQPENPRKIGNMDGVRTMHQDDRKHHGLPLDHRKVNSSANLSTFSVFN
ncbi:hypothetical protein ROZALSC1DRAFT_25591, partial [Rozella allomycis CSF55]